MSTICERVVGTIPEAQRLLAQSVIAYCEEARRSLDVVSSTYHKCLPDDGFAPLADGVRNPFILSGRRYDSFSSWLDTQYLAHDVRLQNPIMPFIAAHVSGGRKTDYASVIGHRYLPATWPPSAKDFTGYLADACILQESNKLWQKISREIDDYACSTPRMPLAALDAPSLSVDSV